VFFRKSLVFLSVTMGLATPAFVVTVTDHTLVRPEGLWPFIAVDCHD
jgi:hypothetical protein